MTPCTAAHQASLSFTISWSFLKLLSIEPVILSNHLILCHSLLLPSIFPSIRVFSSESALHVRWPKYWCFSFSISPSNDYSGLISFKIDWFELLAVQRTLKSLLQHYSLNVSIPQRLSLLYGPTFTPVHDSWKTHSFDCMDLCRQSDVSAFYYVVWVCHNFSSKERVCFNFMAAVPICSDFGAQEICYCLWFFPIYLP